MQHHRLLAAASAIGATVVLATGGGAVAAAEPAAAVPQACDTNYTDGCVPISQSDLDCDDVGEQVTVVGEDRHNLDDGGVPGLACESYPPGRDGGGGADDGAGTDDGGLAETGSSSAELVGVAGLTLLGGVVALVASRRRTA